MNPQHRRSVDRSLADPLVAITMAAQLANALSSLDRTTGSSATHWLERVYDLTGRLHLYREGCGLNGARRIAHAYNAEAYERHLGPYEASESNEGEAEMRITLRAGERLEPEGPVDR